MSLTIQLEMGFVLNFITTTDGTFLLSRGVLSVSTLRLWQPILSFTRVLLEGFFRDECR